MINETFLGGFFLFLLVWDVTRDGRLKSMSFLFSLKLVMEFE